MNIPIRSYGSVVLVPNDIDILTAATSKLQADSLKYAIEIAERLQQHSDESVSVFPNWQATLNMFETNALQTYLPNILNNLNTAEPEPNYTRIGLIYIVAYVHQLPNHFNVVWDTRWGVSKPDIPNITSISVSHTLSNSLIAFGIILHKNN